MVKKLVSAAIGAGLVLATFAPAAFAQNLCGNQTTGPNSNNTCTRDLLKKVKLKVNNSGNVTHHILSWTSTGNNTSDNNTNGGGVNAGAASGTVMKVASLNTGDVTMSQTDPAVEDQGLNDTTGPSSNNTVTFNTTKKMKVQLDNSGNITQNATVVVRSGSNSSSNNTLGGMVTTGDATSDVTIMSSMNDFVIDLSQ